MITPADIGLPEKFSSFRTYPGFSQWQTSCDIADVSKRFIGISAPPGTGKSVLNFAASRIMDVSRTLYLTVNKPLQSQLMNDFSSSEVGLFNLVGHSSYPCVSRSYDRDTGDMLDMECNDKQSCGYWRDVDEALSRSHVVTNYANWISIARVGDKERFGKFDLIILDEAHNLESLLCSLLSIKLSRQGVWELIEKRMPSHDESLSAWVSWAVESRDACLTSLSVSRRQDKIDFHGSAKESLHTKKIMRLLQNLDTIASISDEWVIEPTSSGVQLTPVFAANYAEQYLFRGIEKVILSSATLTSQDFSYLGIAPSDFYLFDIESGFDAARRPYIYWPTTTIDFQMVEGQMIQVMRRIDQFIDSRAELGRKGLIHSISYRYAEIIKRASRSPIVTYKPHEAQQAISRFMASTSPSTLCGPNFAEGYDFKDDLARYQFIWKVPTVDSRHPLIAARKKRDRKYTLYLAGKTIQQMAGRVMRSTSDYGETVILDRHWGNWMMNSIPWPKSFRKSWVTVRDLPAPIKF